MPAQRRRPDSQPQPERKPVSEHLAEETGRPAEEFEPDYDEYPLPELDDLEWEDVDN